jgi:alanyl-tRNA synthetase
MEFNRLPGGSLEPLRFASVDTGCGLERMSMVLQGCGSVYETDLFVPIVAAVGSALAGTSASQRDIRLVADHVRASTFILGEGVAPSNEGRGYIPRRLLRTAIATATQAGAGDFDLGDVASAVIGHMRHAYPRLGENRDRILALLGPRAARLRPGGPPRPGPALRAGHQPRLRDQRRGRVRAVRHARDAG